FLEKKIPSKPPNPLNPFSCVLRTSTGDGDSDRRTVDGDGDLFLSPCQIRLQQVGIQGRRNLLQRQLAYSELAAGMLQVVVDCAVEPYGLLGLVPIVKGAGGIITDWQGNQLSWQPSPASSVPRNSFKVVAASDLITHQQIISELS
ncbi:hypothetical protein H5410_020144, partial [Solanum commersonii]